MAQNLVIGSVIYNGVESMEMTNSAGKKITYIEKVNAGPGVYVAEIGERKFYTVEDALKAAVSGETVKVTDNVAENVTLIVPAGVTLDLNGKNLEVNNATALPGGHIIDSFKNRDSDKVLHEGGILKVGKNALILAADNSQIPLWNGVDGYVFSTVAFSNQKLTHDTENDTASVRFTPWFDYVDENYVMNDAASTGVKALIRSSWTVLNADGTVNGKANQDFVFDASQLQYIVQQQGKKAMSVTLQNVSAKMELTMTAMIVSDAGVAICGTPYTVANA